MENSYIKASDVKKNGRTAYYKMLERVRMGEFMLLSTNCLPVWLT